ncbi:MAG: GNAT family N-acetyltransferase [Anaerolineae bacterium]|nr:GNAT family N-acetyltransferase [Anaerolineae bacterium]
MPTTTIRQLSKQEAIDTLFDATTYAFNPSPPIREKAEWEARFANRVDHITVFAIYEGETPVATVASTPMIEQVRGKNFGMGGIFGVATYPEARRKGYIKQLLVHLMQNIRADQRPLATLYPFRESFYERMGFVNFPQPRKAIFNPADLAPLLKIELHGDVKRMLDSQGYDIYRQYVLEHRGRIHGMAVLEHPDPVPCGKERTWLAAACLNGEIVGVMLYKLEGEEVTKFKLNAQRFYYHKPEGRYLLLQWIAHHIDQANRAELWLPPYEQPETWFADMDTEFERIWIPPMGRVLDVAALRGMQTGPAEFCARVEDPLCAWNNGTWKFEGRGGILEVSPASDADCELSIQGLSALVYGTHAPADFAIRGWSNPSPEVQAAMQTIFPPKMPYLHEMF